MSDIQEYMRRLRTLTNRYRREDGSFGIGADNREDFKLEIKGVGHTKRELRLLKKEIRLTMADIRSAYNAEISVVGNPSAKKGIMAGLFGKRTIGRMNVSQREHLRQAKRSELQNYEELILILDQFTLQLDKLKLDAERQLIQNS